MKQFHEPSKETLAVLNGSEWIASFSGGKDSTALVTWIEWLRRAGKISCPTARLVQSDTAVEYPFLQAIASDLTHRLEECGWECHTVRPRLQDRLYNSIFGRGVPPIHPGIKRMRWCTRATKTDPMSRFSKTLGDDVIHLTGVRWGESDQRDGKLKASGCAAGGECGLPEPGEGRYAPIITWKLCSVLDWLGGLVAVDEDLSDLLAIAARLLDIYSVRTEAKGLGGWITPDVTSLRFGCIGCPAVSRDHSLDSACVKIPAWRALRSLYWVWDELYKGTNRITGIRRGKWVLGPIRMEARRRMFTEVLRIQAEAGVAIVTAEDTEFIRRCWDRRVYPRGWSEADEATMPPLGNLYPLPLTVATP